MANEAALSIAKAEGEAARLVRSGGFLARAWLTLHAGISLALDPSDTRQVFRMVVAGDLHSLERIHARLAASEAGRALLRDRPAVDSRHVDLAALRALPADSLGGAYARMIDKAQLDPDLFQAPEFLDAELAYVSQRIRQTHDLWHVLTGLSTRVDGEIMLQAFTHGQFPNRTARTIATFGTLIYGFRFPHLWKQTWRWFRAGKRASFLLAVPWESLWHEPVAALRARFDVSTAPLR
jgi:ubiquinone biosynthesis protein COQ4